MTAMGVWITIDVLSWYLLLILASECLFLLHDDRENIDFPNFFSGIVKVLKKQN